MHCVTFFIEICMFISDIMEIAGLVIGCAVFIVSIGTIASILHVYFHKIKERFAVFTLVHYFTFQRGYVVSIGD